MPGRLRDLCSRMHALSVVASSCPGSACEHMGPPCAATVKRPSPPLGASLPHSSSGSIFSGSVQERCQVTNQTQQPGPGRSTSDAAFTALKKEIAERNELAQKKARKLRAAREQEHVRRRREEDLR